MKKINIRKIYYHVRHNYFTLNNVVVVVALLIAASWAWGSVEVMQRNYDLQKEVDGKAREQKLLELETATLTFEQRYYKSDEYKELAVRERLGLAKPGERVLVLPPNSVAATQADDVVSKRQPASTVQPSDFQQWMNFIFGGNSKSLQ
jgi:cell division protein FtsB